MNVDVIIPYRSTLQYPTGELLQQCVESIYSKTRNTRLIVVDDNSDDAGSDFASNLMRRFPNSLFVRTGFQRWFTRAVNIGLNLTRTEQVVTINSDCVVDTGWLDEMVDVWNTVEKETGRKVGLVGSLQSVEEPRRYQISVPADYVTGHCWLLSMAAMNEAANSRGTPGRYLDETSALNIHIRSDVSICWDLHRLGWQCVKSFKSAVGHYGGRSWGHNVWQVQTLRLEDVAERYT